MTEESTAPNPFDFYYQSVSSQFWKQALTNPFFHLDDMLEHMDIFKRECNSFVRHAAGYAFIPLACAKVANQATKSAPILHELNNTALDFMGKQFDFLREATKNYHAPKPNVQKEVADENELARLCVCTDDNYEHPGKIKDYVYLEIPPIMRGPTMLFYEIPGSEHPNSIGRSLLRSHAGRLAFIDWKNPEGPALDARLDDIVETEHRFTVEMKKLFGRKVININNCQPGYVDMIRLSRYPDDAHVTVQVGSPHKTLDPNSLTYNNIVNYSADDINRVCDRSGGVFPGRLIAESWGLANFELLAKKVCQDPVDLYLDVINDKLNASKRDTFNSWNPYDVRNVARGVMLDIRDIFANERMINEPLRSAQRNYRNGLIVVLGSSDNITTFLMGRTVKEVVGSSPDLIMEYIVEGGHAAVFLGTKPIMTWNEHIIPSTQRLADKVDRRYSQQFYVPQNYSRLAN